MPDNVLRTAFAQLSVPECWLARQVSGAWAGQARRVACFDRVIQADSTSIVNMVQALCSQRLQQKFPGVHITFCLTEPLRLRSLSCLLLQLWDKVCLLHTAEY